MPYPNKQAVVDALLPPGWKLVGDAPHMVTVPNPDAGKPGQPATISQDQGIVLSVQGPAGTTPDKIIIKQVGNAPWKGGVGYDVVQGPQNALPKDTTPTPIKDWARVDESGNPVAEGGKAAFLWDPKTGSVLKLEAGSQTGDPSKWETKVVAGATIVYDPVGQKVVATVPASASDASKRTGVYTNVTDPNDPKRVIAMVDTGSGEWNVVARQAGKQVITTPTKVLVLNDDGTVAQEHAVEQQPTLVTLGDEVFVFDPKDKSFTAGPKGTKPATVGISTNNEYYVFFDDQGKEISRSKNPNYQGQPQPGQAAQSTTAPQIQQWNPQTGRWEWVENKGRVTIGQATQDMIKQLTGQTVDPNNPMTLDEANTLLQTAISKMTADAQQTASAAGAAQNVLSTQAQGATTGAGILNQRAQTAQNLVQQGLNVATSTGGRYGNYSGGMLSPVPGLGANLVQGAASYATELGGGQEVFDTAVRMVQAADPNGQNPDRAAAVGVLTQIMDKYKQATGQDHPTVAATKAAAASAATGGMAAPVTSAPAAVVSPVQAPPAVFQAQFDPRFNPAAPQQPVNTVLPAGVAGTVAPDDPRRLRPRSAQELAGIGGFTAPALV